MDFYTRLAEHYDEIFPLDRATVLFVEEVFANRPAKPSLLDIGCATGSLARSLAAGGISVIGIDTNAKMVRIAEAGLAPDSSPSSLSFRKADMLSIENDFSDRRFNGIICFGNTLVHLPGEKEVLAFFRQARGRLTPEGKLLIQILNYDYILDFGVFELPAIETPAVSFRRKYLLRMDGRLDFAALLLLKGKERIHTSSLPLLPLRKDRLDALLGQAGFMKRRYYRDFRFGDYQAEGMLLVVNAS